MANGIFERKSNGKIICNAIELEILMLDLLDTAKDEEECEWIREQIDDCLDLVFDEKVEEL